MLDLLAQFLMRRPGWQVRVGFTAGRAVPAPTLLGQEPGQLTFLPQEWRVELHDASGLRCGASSPDQAGAVIMALKGVDYQPTCGCSWVYGNDEQHEDGCFTHRWNHREEEE